MVKVHAKFTMTSGSGSQIVRVDVTSQLYNVNWNTDPSSEPVGSSFRIAVIVHKAVLGFADVDMVAAGRATNANTGGDVPLVNAAPCRSSFASRTVRSARATRRSIARAHGKPGDRQHDRQQQPAGGHVHSSRRVESAGDSHGRPKSSRRCIPAPFALPEFEDCYDFFTDRAPSSSTYRSSRPCVSI